MFLTEKEILDTPVALDLTCKYFEENAEKIEASAEKVHDHGLRLQLYALQERGRAAGRLP